MPLPSAVRLCVTPDCSCPGGARLFSFLQTGRREPVDGQQFETGICSVQVQRHLPLAAAGHELFGSKNGYFAKAMRHSQATSIGISIRSTETVNAGVVPTGDCYHQPVAILPHRNGHEPRLSNEFDNIEFAGCGFGRRRLRRNFGD